MEPGSIRNNLVLRPFTEEHVETAIALASRLGLSHWSANDYRAEIKRSDSVMTTAMLNGRLAGFIVGRLVPASQVADRMDAEIYNIGVATEFQKSGVATQLLTDFIDRCHENSVIDVWLEVRSRNEAAIRFYEKFNFEQFSARPGFYREPTDDALVMRLTSK